MDETKSKGRQLAMIRRFALTVLVIVYAIVFCSTLKVHNQSSRPTTPHGPARGLHKQRNGARGRGTTELTSTPNADDGKYAWTSGEEVTQILKKKLPFPNEFERLRFRPGGLNMTHAQALHRCWAGVYRSKRCSQAHNLDISNNSRNFRRPQGLQGAFPPRRPAGYDNFA